MKITKTQQPKKEYRSINLTINLRTEADALAFFAISRWDITIPDQAITCHGATRNDVRDMIRQFQRVIEPHNLFEAKSLPRVEVTFESQYEVDQAKLYEKVPGLSDALADKSQPWKVGDTVYLRGFHPKRTIQYAPRGQYQRCQYQLVDEEGNVQCGPGTATEVSKWVVGPNSMYTHEVQKRHPKIGDKLYHEGKDERRIVSDGCDVRIAYPDGYGHHYASVTTLKGIEGIEELIDQGVYTYEPR